MTQRPQGCRLQLAHLLLRYAGSRRDFRRGLVHPIPPLDFLSLALWKPLHGPVKGIPYSDTLQDFRRLCVWYYVGQGEGIVLVSDWCLQTEGPVKRVEAVALCALCLLYTSDAADD